MCLLCVVCIPALDSPLTRPSPFPRPPCLSSMLAVKPQTRTNFAAYCILSVDCSLFSASIVLAPFLMNVKEVAFHKSSISVTNSLESINSRPSMNSAIAMLPV